VTRRLLDLTRFETLGILRRRWYLLLVAIGALTVPIAALTAAAHVAALEADSYRASAASLLLIGGLTVALALGATTIATGGASGHLGLLVASGAGRAQVTLARLAGRFAALVVALVAWCVALQAGSAALGRGFDWPLTVHVAASLESLAVVMLAAAATSTVMGPAVAVVVGLMVHITSQAVVNLEAAANLGFIRTWDRLAHVAYNLFPRAVYSPMIVDMQNRGQGGPAAPRFELNQVDRGKVPIPLEAASIGTVLWTAFWCCLLAWLCVIGMRRRAL
jgi:hypothetical protein